MRDQELSTLQIKLVNIIQDKFQKPSATEGRNILLDTDKFICAIQEIWPDGEFDDSDIDACLSYLEFDFIKSTTGKILWLIKPND